jgi:hypothetical protein
MGQSGTLHCIQSKIGMLVCVSIAGLLLQGLQYLARITPSIQSDASGVSQIKLNTVLSARLNVCYHGFVPHE